jgi:hypothetical protein
MFFMFLNRITTFESENKVREINFFCGAKFFKYNIK